VFLAVLAERWFGFHLGPRQWVGLTITAAGLVLIGLTGTGQGSHHYSLAALVRISSQGNIAPRDEALLLATAAGVLFGVSDIAIKYLSHAQNPVFGLITPWTLTAAISFVNSFYASARRASTRHPEPTASSKRPHHLDCRGRGTPAASLVDSAVPRWA